MELTSYVKAVRIGFITVQEAFISSGGIKRKSIHPRHLTDHHIFLFVLRNYHS